MQVNRNDAVDANGLHKTSYVRCRNGHTGLHFTILTSIAIVGNDNSNAPGTGTTQGRYHEQQFHQIVIHWRARGLHNINVLSSNILLDNDVHFAIGESAHRRPPQTNAQMMCDFHGQRHVAVSRKHLDATRVLLRLSCFLFQSSLRGCHFRGESTNVDLWLCRNGIFTRRRCCDELLLLLLLSMLCQQFEHLFLLFGRYLLLRHHFLQLCLCSLLRFKVTFFVCSFLLPFALGWTFPWHSSDNLSWDRAKHQLVDHHVAPLVAGSWSWGP
mmetsp:Transcript_11131/g.26737  ORF Transcript_11131/g.26737 Transcript_11131/m.26737 type:complete len:270 (-) Transcript_11131:519-1328(-)